MFHGIRSGTSPSKKKAGTAQTKERRHLNDIQCRNAKSQAKPYKLTDGKGLYLEVKLNGVKAWRYRFKLASRKACCRCPQEKERGAQLGEAGRQPAHHRQLEKIKHGQDAANTFGAVAQEWLALRDWEKVTKDRRLDMLQRVVFPTIGQLPVKQVTPAHILDILQRTAKERPTVTAEARAEIQFAPQAFAGAGGHFAASLCPASRQ